MSLEGRGGWGGDAGGFRADRVANQGLFSPGAQRLREGMPILVSSLLPQKKGIFSDLERQKGDRRKRDRSICL